MDQPFRKDTFDVDSLVYVGDHPGMRPETTSLSTPVSKGLLYVEAASDHWIPLYPFINVLYCPKCDSRETYVLDKWEGSVRYSLKSFERDHEVDQSYERIEIGSDLENLFE
jgi:hypothetical protein